MLQDIRLLQAVLPMFTTTLQISLKHVMLQVLLYLISNYTHDYTRFQLYYAVDLALTLSMAALLPLTLREVKRA